MKLQQLASVHIPRGAIRPRETFIPLRHGFGQGDALDKHEVALADAVSQRALFESGSPRDRLYAMQESIARGLQDGTVRPIECPLQHLFPPGLYMRTIFLRAGGQLVGKIHKHRHGNILSVGRVKVYTEAGGVEDLRGPLQMISEPGTKRAVLALEDSVWTTIHLNPDNTQDLAVLEGQIIASTYEEYDAFVRSQQ